MKNLYLTIIIVFKIYNLTQAQIFVYNKSFEGKPKMGMVNFNMEDWIDCGYERFGESCPDIHPDNLFGVESPPSEGKSYIGMVVRDNATYESICTRVSKNLEKDKCYQFTIDLCKSPNYLSKSRLTSKDMNYNKPVVFRVWGGNSSCSASNLLAISTLVDHEDWRKYSFKIQPKQNCRYIILEAYYDDKEPYAYCGNLLMDNMSNILEFKCD